MSSACIFCKTLNEPELVVAGTGGNTCRSIHVLAAKEVNGSDTCVMIQKEERVCCPGPESAPHYNTVPVTDKNIVTIWRQQNPRTRHATRNRPVLEQNAAVSFAELQGITNKLLGPDNFGNGCPPGCGCKRDPVDCPQHYSIEDVIKSADAVLDVSSSLYRASQLELQHADAMKKCQNTDYFISANH